MSTTKGESDLCSPQSHEPTNIQDSNASQKSNEDEALPTEDENTQEQTKPSEKDVEVGGEKPALQANITDVEDFSSFTVPQKRAIIFAGSFISWFSPMTGSIYYPALNQVRR